MLYLGWIQRRSVSQPNNEDRQVNNEELQSNERRKEYRKEIKNMA